MDDHKARKNLTLSSTLLLSFDGERDAISIPSNASKNLDSRTCQSRRDAESSRILNYLSIRTWLW